MTLALAALILLAYPATCGFLRANPHKRHWAFVVIGALPLFPDLPNGFLFGWPNWSGVVRGFGISFITVIAMALLTVGKQRGQKLPFWGIFAFYALTMVISIFNSSMWLATLFVWWQFGLMMILFAAVGKETHLPDMRASILTGFSIGLTYQASFSIFQKLTGVVQAPGTFIHQNILGLAVELSLLPLIAAALAGDRRKSVIVGIIAALICIAGSGSRATMGITAAATILLGVLSLARRVTPRKIAAFSAGVALLAVITPLAIATLNDRFKGQAFITEDLERARFEKAAVAMSADYPLGIGANQFAFVSNSRGYADAAQIGWQTANRSVPVHNAYLLARAETGWAGQLAFTLMLAIPCLAGFALAFRERKGPTGDILLGSAVALVANMVHNMYEFASHDFSIQALLMVNIGLIAAELAHRRKTKRSRRVTVTPAKSPGESSTLAANGSAGSMAKRHSHVEGPAQSIHSTPLPRSRPSVSFC